jgi:hypothetical protein
VADDNSGHGDVFVEGFQVCLFIALSTLIYLFSAQTGHLHDCLYRNAKLLHLPGVSQALFISTFFNALFLI